MKRFLTRVIATLTAIAMLTTIGLLTLPTATASTGTTVSQTPMRYGETTITNANVAYVYSLLAQELIKNTPPEAIEVLQSRGVSVEEVAQAYELFISDHPECFWIGKSYVCSRVGGKVVSIKPDYSFWELRWPRRGNNWSPSSRILWAICRKRITMIRHFISTTAWPHT